MRFLFFGGLAVAYACSMCAVLGYSVSKFFDFTYNLEKSEGEPFSMAVWLAGLPIFIIWLALTVAGTGFLIYLAF
jgi:hypothetical protein